jgi:hypothetical protein
MVDLLYPYNEAICLITYALIIPSRPDANESFIAGILPYF